MRVTKSQIVSNKNVINSLGKNVICSKYVIKPGEKRIICTKKVPEY